MEAICPSETSVESQQTTRRHVPEDDILYVYTVHRLLPYHPNPNPINIGCFKKSFTTLKEYINLFRGHVKCFEMS
jgi:hypothetical protein